MLTKRQFYTFVNRKSLNKNIIKNNYKNNNFILFLKNYFYLLSGAHTISLLFILTCLTLFFVNADDISSKHERQYSSRIYLAKSSSYQSGSGKKLNSFPYDDCVLEKECDVNHSTDVRKLFYGCVCDCKPGWTGLRCNSSSTFYKPYYKIEYNIKCTYVPIEPGWECGDVGEGWILASSSTPEDNENIKSLVFSPTWLSGYKKNRPNDPTAIDRNLYTWRFDRAAGITFATFNSCIPGAYCNFAPEQPPNNYYLGGPSVYISPDGFWRVDNSQCITSDCTPVSCSVCQRSACNYTIDCFKGGAVSLSGYYPSCKCECKEGFHGSKCDTVTDPDTKIDYVIGCNNTIDGVVTFDNAMSGCKAYGNDWNLATVNSAGANNMLSKKFADYTAWLGGSSSGNSGSWRWLSGRLNGKEFYKKGSGTIAFTNWEAGRPQEETCGNEKRDFLTISNGNWMDSYGVSVTCAGAPVLPKCYICERQPCIFSTDCNVSNSYNVSGYYPKCYCSCKDGWGGSTCDLNNTITNGLYFSEYKVQCFDEGLNFDLLDSVCKSFGPGYVVASIPNKAVNDFIANSSFERIWTGAIMNSNGNFPNYTGNQWYWEGNTRVSRHFATNYSCLNGAYCNFKPTELLNQECYGSQKQRLVINGSTSRYWDLTSDFLDCFKKTKCVACERSLCSIDLDCTTNATDRVVGYYPNCQCICSFGHIGDKCEIKSLINFGNYSSSFNVFCRHDFVSHEKAYQYCKENGPGWMFATVPNKEAHELISTLSQENNVWLAGSDVDVVGEWRWRAGRFSGKAFYTSSGCVGSSFCPWDSSEPKHESKYCSPIVSNVSTNYLLLKNEMGERHWRAAYGDLWCSLKILPKCYACERSLCTFYLDCDSSSSTGVIGYFPDCKCRCIKGFGGRRCDISVDPNRTCPFNVESCEKDDTRDLTVMKPLYKLSVSLNGLNSMEANGIVLVLSLITVRYSFDYVLSIVDSLGRTRSDIYLEETIVLDDAIMMTVVANDDEITDISSLYLHLSSADIISNCCSQVSTVRNSNFGATNVRETFKIGELKLLPYAPLPESGKRETYIDKNAQETVKNLKPFIFLKISDYTELFGPHSDQIVLRALSPFALMITINNDGYSGIIVSNLTAIIFIVVIHLFVVIALKSYNKYSFREACTAVSFPSMPIYVVYALLPGTAVASGELIADLNGIGFVGLVILLVTSIASFAVPYLCLSRALFEIPLKTVRISSRVYLLFPSAIIGPREERSMFGSMIGNIRSHMPLWPTLPIWSSVLLFIFAAIQPRSSTASMALYVALAILHCIIIIMIAYFRPLTSISLNVIYVLGILPVVFLCIALAATAGTDSYVTGTVPRVFLILFTIVNAIRLAIAVASPLRVFDIFDFSDLLDSPVWTYTAHYFIEKKKVSYSHNPL